MRTLNKTVWIWLVAVKAFECYTCAVTNTGTDPFDLAKQVKKYMVRF